MSRLFFVYQREDENDIEGQLVAKLRSLKACLNFWQESINKESLCFVDAIDGDPFTF